MIFLAVLSYVFYICSPLVAHIGRRTAQMESIMTVQTFVPPDSSTQSAADYPPIVDSAISVLTRLGDNFAPHAQSVPDLTVALDAGHVMSGQVLVEKTAQNTAALTAPTTNPRIDRVVIDNLSGNVSVVTGVESASPTAPAIPIGTSPVAQVLLQTTSTAITNAMLTDERDFSNVGTAPGTLLNGQTFSSSGTYTPSAGTTKIIVEVQGGGASGGSCAATTATTSAAASGGGAGGYGRALITSGFSGATVTVGAGGAPSAAGSNDGNNGGDSSFGSIVVAGGGKAGRGGFSFVPPSSRGSGGVSNLPTGANLVAAVGASGHIGFTLSTSAIAAGDGASSYFGGGAPGAGPGAGPAAVSPGAGGGGAAANASSVAHSGGAGANGIVIVYEYA